MTPLVHRPAPHLPARVNSIAFVAWIASIPVAKREQAARVARYLAIRANRSQAGD